MRNLVRFCIALTITLAFGVAYFIYQPAHAQSSCVTQPAGIVAWYPGDGNAKDIVRANNGTLQGNATYAAGQSGQSFSFDGDHDAVSVGNPEQLRLQDFTIETWIKRGSATKTTVDFIGGGALIFGYGQNGYAFYMADDGHLFLSKAGVNNIGSYGSGNFPDLKITDTNFHHVAVTKSGIYVTFYIDGVASNRAQYDTQFEFTSNANIGAYSDAYRNSFLGLIDELSIYNRALNQSDIQTVFNAGAAGKCKATSVQFERATYPSSSTSGTVNVTVTRMGDTSGTGSVQYATSDGTAKAGVNYTATSGVLNFAAGEQSKTISIPILNNSAAAGDTSFQISLSNAGNATVGATTTATLDIFKAPAGAGRILLPAGDLYSDYLQAFNTDGTNNFQLSYYRYGTHSFYPSVARLTGMIAFEGCGDFLPTGTTCEHGRRIFVMNGDGSGFRQVTTDAGLDQPQYQNDDRPVISPDGTKIAFISQRPPASYNFSEAFVVNTDGTNLHPVTTHQKIDDNYQSRADSVVWSPDSQRLLVHAFRLDKDNNGNPTVGIGSLFTYNADGTGETIFRRNVSNGNGGIAVDWSPDGRSILYANKGGPYHGTYGYVFLDALNPDKSSYLSATQLGATHDSYTDTYSIGGDVGSVRFSPDGQKILYGDNQDNSVRTANLDGTNIAKIVTDYYYWNQAKWWWPGAAIPKADHLTLTPNPVLVFGVKPAQVTPTLYDAQGNVIFHSADFTASDTNGFICDSNHPCSGNPSPQVTVTGLVYNFVDGSGTRTLCGTNAGKSACTFVSFNAKDALLGVSATKATTFTSGKDGPGVFTVTRYGDPQSSFTKNPLTFTIALSGTAKRDVDYMLDFTGNTVTIPAGQSSVDINIRPLGAHGDKTVILTLQPDQQNAYSVTEQNSATLTIKDDGASKNLSLSSMTPNKGGDKGSVSAIVYGQNIKQGAIVKLTRSGQPDIIGENTRVAANGSSITARFNLIGKAQGAWDVVVTNPDNTTAKLTGAFTIQPSTDARVWVDITGRDVIRASHIATTYTVTYGNRGNVDAYMVPLFITGIPKDAEVKLFMDLLPTPGAPAGQEKLSPVTTFGATQAISLFIPIVPAGSVNYIRFSIRFTVISQNRAISQSKPFNSISGVISLSKPFKLRASMFPPLMEAVNSTTNQNSTALNENGKATSGSFASRHGGDYSTLAFEPAKAAPCFYSLFSNALSCAAGFVFPSDCIYSVYSLLSGTALTLTGYDFYGSGPSLGFSGLSFLTGVGSAAIACAGDAAKELSPLGLAFNILNCLYSLGGFVTDVATTDCNPFTSEQSVTPIESADPNVKIGARGKTDQHYISGLEPLRYAIYFENKPEASANAQTVVVTDQLNPSKMDLSTFSLGLIGFGDTVVNVPPGLKSYNTDVDLRPSQNLIVRIQAALDSSTGIVTWRFTSIDPATNQATTDPAAGFLPPNKTGTEGEGNVLFTVMPHANLPTGTDIRNTSRIVFDLNAPLDTNEWRNTIDNSNPASRVQSLSATQNSVIFNVNWSGTDTGSGISTYDVYVAENGGQFTIWRQATTNTSDFFIGKPATRYDFYSVARDAAGNVENNKSTLEATTTTTNAVQTVIDDTRFFVRQQYLDFLNREPDQGGWDYWTSLIAKCAATDQKCINSQRVSVSAAFFIEQEFQDTGSFVYRFYKGSLGRQPVFSEFVKDRSGVVGGANLEASKAAFADAWTQRAEFLAKYPANLSSDAFVDALLQTIKQTSNVDLTSQRQTFINQLQATGGTRGQVIRAVVDTKAFQAAEYNRAFVLMQYFGYLRRDPDASGYQFWLDVLNNRVPNNYRSMVCAFINSAEYQLRFGPVVSRTDQVCSTIGQ